MYVRSSSSLLFFKLGNYLYLDHLISQNVERTNGNLQVYGFCPGCGVVANRVPVETLTLTSSVPLNPLGGGATHPHLALTNSDPGNTKEATLQESNSKA